MLCYTRSMVMHRQAPALDRRAILGIAEGGDYDDSGEWLAGDVTEHGIWAALKDSMIGIEAEIDGVSQEADAELIARYRADVITEAMRGEIGNMTGKPFIGWYLQFENVKYAITGANELAIYGRRRFMKIMGRLES